jgi:hypothetical protein
LSWRLASWSINHYYLQTEMLGVPLLISSFAFVEIEGNDELANNTFNAMI